MHFILGINTTNFIEKTMSNKHNKIVSDNIQELRDLTEEAKTEQNLIDIINKVKEHPGPLDYDNRMLIGISATLVYFILIGIAQFNVIGYDSPSHTVSTVSDFIGAFTSLLYFTVKVMLVCLPAVVSVFIVKIFEKRGVAIPLPEKLNHPFNRMSLIALLATGLFCFFLDFYQVELSLTESLLYANYRGYYIYISPIMGVVLFIVVLCLCFWWYLRKNWRTGLSNDIYARDILLDNELTVVDLSVDNKKEDLLDSFEVFKRGDPQLREIKALYKTYYRGEVHSFDFEVFQFEYTIVKTRTSTDSKGRRTTTRDYYTYYRQGVMVDFPWVKNVLVSSDSTHKLKGNTYKTESNDFNKKYRVYADDSMSAARLLTPSMVEFLMELEQKDKALELEFRDDGRLCMIFNGTDITSTNRRSAGLNEPDQFVEVIRAHRELKLLDQLKVKVHSIMELCDNNFINY